MLDKARIMEAVKSIIRAIGEDPEREGRRAIVLRYRHLLEYTGGALHRWYGLLDVLQTHDLHHVSPCTDYLLFTVEAGIQANPKS